MEQHPIPQPITSYEFKLVGEMTLKQFLKAGGGIVVALLINATKLVFFIKWPLMILFGGGGLALAFVPFQDRPLEKWIVAFIKSIYFPTIYTYKKRANNDWLETDMVKAKATAEEKKKKEEELPIKDQGKVEEFIESLPSVKKEEKVPEKEVVKINPVKSEEETVKKETNWRDQTTDLKLKKEKLKATGRASFGSIPMPDIPEIPNIVVGMVTDTAGKIVEGTILEILDAEGNPVRVLKTNALGQFRISTPLANGQYLIIPEKKGLNFDRVSIDLLGKIVQPIKIQSV
ncbi:MAG: PrgI family protein [Candidatus Shapirobacteria bacterium]